MDREVIIEIQQLGDAVKVTAIDVATGREVVAMGAPQMTQAELKQLGLAKLNYVLGKE